MYIFFYGSDERHGDDHHQLLPSRSDRDMPMYMREHADDVTAGTIGCRKRIIIIMFYDIRGCVANARKDPKEILQKTPDEWKLRSSDEVALAITQKSSVGDTCDSYGGDEDDGPDEKSHLFLQDDAPAHTYTSTTTILELCSLNSRTRRNLGRHCVNNVIQIKGATLGLN